MIADFSASRGLRLVRKRLAVSSLVIGVIALIVIIALAGGIYYYVSFLNTTNVGSSSTHSPLILYSADAYVAEATALENGFQTSSRVQMVPPKSAGSLTLGQEIAQGNPVSVFLSVAKSAVSSSVLGSTFSGWAIAFEADQMAITYSNATTQNSAGASVVDSYQTAQSANTTRAWFDFFSNVTSGSVKVGISDPNADPAGFRAWLVLEAAGYLYGNNNTSYFVNRMLSNHGNITAGSAADLVAPLEEGNIQFLFIYKSAGIAEKLNVVQLPAQVSLGSPAYSSLYSQFSYSTSSGAQKGGLIALFITVPKDTTDFTDSVSFVAFVVKNAASLLSQYGLQSISPAQLYNDSAVPQPIKQLITQGYLSEGGTL